MPSWRSIAVVAAVALGTITPGVAHAAPPTNDDFDSSTAMTSLPFTAQVDRSEATAGADDPRNCAGGSAEGTVWFSHTATESGFLRISTEGSDLDVMTSVLTGGRGALREAACGSPQSPLVLRVTAGETYHFMAADGYDGRGAAFKLDVQRVQALANDNFADAQPVPSIPFRAPEPDFSLATFERDEPTSSACRTWEGTPSVWYTYTPAQTQFVLGRVTEHTGPTLAVYEGDSLPNLRSLGCATPSWNGGRVFKLEAGTKYHLQLQNTPSSRDSALELSVAPALEAEVSTSSGERSIFRDVEFSLYHRNGFDAAITTEWDFGDGTTAAPSTDRTKAHRYTKDGEYTVTVRSTSEDGRTATDTLAVTVKTHDVGIAKFTVPASARAGQQKQISVQVSNTRYLEKDTVVTLYKYGEWGWQEVGVLKLDVPAHPTRKVTFPFAYTFTNEDAALGKMTFRATVSLPYPAYDSLPLDNEAISTATTVRPAATATALTN
jgi:hypothetical protein